MDAATRTHKGFQWLVFLAVVCCLSAVHAQNPYACPYSGPIDDPTLDIDVTRYILTLAVDFPSTGVDGAVHGTATVEGVSLADGLSVVRLDFLKDDKAFVTAVRSADQPAAWTFDTHEIRITLPAAIDRDEPFEVSVDYRVEGMNHFQYKPKDDARFAFNAMVENSRWFPCLHDPRDKALYEFRITVEDPKTVAANGTLQAKENRDGRATFVWIENNPMASYLATLNIAEYTSFGHTHDAIPVVYYVLPEKLDAAQADFARDDQILDFYATAFGPYPFEKLGLAQVQLMGAMENQDMISYGSALITGDGAYEDTFAHEISHMYWGNSVTLTGCEDVWLNEGFASYCEALWEEHITGQESYDAVMAEFRDRYFEEDAQNRFPIFDPQIVWGATTYKKGAWVLHMLRRVTGDEIFWTILQDYYAQKTYGHATTEFFQSICEAQYGADLDWFFIQWIYDMGYPEYEIAHRYADGKLTVWVTQVQENAPEVFRMPAEIEWTLSGGETHVEHVIVSKRLDVFQFNASAAPTSVVFDPGDSILKKSTVVQSPGLTRVAVSMPGTLFHPGDLCGCSASVVNLDTAPIDGYPLFVVLDVYGSYFFAPGFTEFDSYLDDYPAFPLGITTIDVLPEFVWPAGVGSANGIKWYAALTDPAMTGLYGELGTWEFGWTEEGGK